MEFENIEIVENVDEAIDAIDTIEEVIPEKGFKLSVGEGVLIAAAVTAAVVGVVALVKKVRANKARQEELADEKTEDPYDGKYMDVSDTDEDVDDE